MNSLISVIIPIYKVENYLNRCIKSIVEQSYDNIEIILVDDGSPDKCPSICDEWSKIDNRIKVIHKENGGLADARNAGLAIASGDYIGFVDSDDWITTDMYEKLIKIANNEQCQIVQCKAIKTENENISEIKTDKPITLICHSEDAMRNLICEKYFTQTVWNKLYHKNVVDNILFEKGKISEDTFWTYQIFAQAKRVAFVDFVGYYYFMRNDSIMGTKYSISHLQTLEALERRCRFIEEKFPSIAIPAMQSYIWSCFYHYLHLHRNPEIDINKKYRREVIKRVHREDKREAMKNLSFKYRIWLTTFTYMPDFVCYVNDLFKIGF